MWRSLWVRGAAYGALIGALLTVAGLAYAFYGGDPEPHGSPERSMAASIVIGLLGFPTNAPVWLLSERVSKGSLGEYLLLPLAFVAIALQWAVVGAGIAWMAKRLRHVGRQSR